jgi:predicted ATPase
MDIELGQLNVLIGANGAGKSNFIQFFKMLNEMVAGHLQLYVATSGRAKSLLYLGPKVTPQLEATLRFEFEEVENSYQMRLSHAANDTVVFGDERLGLPGPQGPEIQRSLGTGHLESKISELAPQKSLAIGETFGVNFAMAYFLGILNDCRVYHFHDTSPTARFRQYCNIRDSRRLLFDAGNLAAMLYRYQRESELVYGRIRSTIRTLIPGFDDFDLKPDRDDKEEITLNWRRVGTDYLFGPHQLSDGTLRTIALVTLLLQPQVELPPLVILDEPELGLHPFALEIIAGLIRAASIKSQVIVATQSQTFLNNFGPEEIIVTDLDQGASQFRRLSATDLKDWLEDYSIGELWQRNVVGGGPLP